MRIGDYEIRVDTTDDGLFATFIGSSLRGPIVAYNDMELLIVVKHDGGHVYSGQGQPWRYAPGHFTLYRLKRWEPQMGIGHGVEAQRIMEWPLR